MKSFLNGLPLVIAIVLLTTAYSFSQNRFEGYSFKLEAGNNNSCPIRYLSGAGGGNSINVFFAGTDQKSPAAGIAACDGSRVNGNEVAANEFGRWCFQGSEELYEIRLKTGETYLW